MVTTLLGNPWNLDDSEPEYLRTYYIVSICDVFALTSGSRAHRWQYPAKTHKFASAKTHNLLQIYCMCISRKTMQPLDNDLVARIIHTLTL